MGGMSIEMCIAVLFAYAVGMMVGRYYK
jgi:hypothetical protein